MNTAFQALCLVVWTCTGSKSVVYTVHQEFLHCAEIDDGQLKRLEHIAHGAAICQAHAAGLLQVDGTLLSVNLGNVKVVHPQYFKQ